MIPPGEARVGTLPEEIDDRLRQLPPGWSRNWLRKSSDNEWPAKRVTLDKPFYLGATEVTAGQFRAFAQSDSDMANMFKSGEIILSDGGRATADDIQKGGGNVAWALPKEGALSWVCGLAISSKADNVDAAYAFINDATSPPTQALFGNSGYVMMNPKAVKLVEEWIRTVKAPVAEAKAKK